MDHTECFTKEGGTLAFEGMKATGVVVGRMLDMTLEQRFRNPGKRNAEVVYTFPLPYAAVLMGIEVTLNGEKLRGDVVAKVAARERYEDALTEGNSAMLLEVQPSGMHTLELGNLLAGEAAVVTLRYAQVLTPERGNLRLTLPTAMAPRYGDPLLDGGYEPHAAPIAPDITVEYPFDCVLRIEGELAMATIQSPSHPTEIKSLPADAARRVAFAKEVRLARRGYMDRDFILTFTDLPQPSQCLTAWDQTDPGVAVLMASFTPQWPQSPDLPLNLKVLVDCSGSMSGDSIQAARSALLQILGELKAGDQFSISRFGSSVEHRKKSLSKVSPLSLESARQWITEMNADLGGTEMVSALVSTFALSPGKSAALLMITDGQVEAVEEVIRSATTSGHRVYVVGIGSACAEHLLRRLAEETGGSCEFVVPGEDVEPAILRLYSRMRSSAVSSAEVRLAPGLDCIDRTSLPTTIFCGDSFTVYLRCKPQTPGALGKQLSFIAQLAGESEPRLLATVTPSVFDDPMNTLARLAASQRYRQLLRQAGDRDSASEARSEMALKYQLVTESTSFVLVKVRNADERAADIPALVQIPHMLAAGWGGHGSVAARAGAKMSSSRNRLHQVPASAKRSVAPQRLRQAAASAMPKPIARGASKSARLLPIEQKSPPTIIKPRRTAVHWIGKPTANLPGEARTQGWTPAGYALWLLLNIGRWPETYADLRKMGLSEAVVEWLSGVIAGSIEEKAVVAGFNQCLFDFGRARLSSAQCKRYHLQLIESMGSLDEDAPLLDLELELRLEEATEKLEPQRWPAEVMLFFTPRKP